MSRFIAVGLAIGGTLLSACGAAPGEDAAQAACQAYAGTTERASALEGAQRAAGANDSYAALAGDMDDARSRAYAMAAAHNGGGQVSPGQLSAYVAADKRVRADCADAGADIGPLEP
jgi:hypothetical protein